MTELPARRMRRMRRTPALRRLVREVSLQPRNLVLPVFVKEGLTEAVEIRSMPGVCQHPLSDIAAVVERAVQAGLSGIMLFGVPERRDASGTGATDPQGILNRAIEYAAAAAAGHIAVQADVCLDEFTDHGHCGVLDASGAVDNDATLERYAEMAIAQARAGADILGLSGMMDGQVAFVRAALDDAGFMHTALLAYSAKYASAWFGPFRDAVESTFIGNRMGYQLDPANAREGIEEALQDIAQGADVVMVKPAGGYLDVLRAVAEVSTVPVWAYQVSGEYALIEAGAAAGVIDRDRAIRESLLSIRRAGAETILSYWAIEAADWCTEGAFE